MTREEFKSYILRALGSPKIQVEIDDTQLEDRVNDAIAMFVEYHYDGSDKQVLIIDSQKRQYEYTLPDNVIDVIQILGEYIPASDELLMMPLTFYNITDFQMNFNAVDYTIYKQSMSLYNDVVKPIYRYDFNGTTKLLRLFEPPIGYKLAMICYTNNVSTTENIYDNRWLQQYTIALAGIQWATNISKYNGISLPGGGQINAETIEQRYSQMKQTLEEQLFENYTPTPQFFYG